MEKKEKLESEKLLGVISVYSNTVLYHPKNKKGLGAGRLLKASSLKSIFKFIEGKSEFLTYSFSGFIPENVLNYNSETGKLIFWTPPQRRLLIFKDDIEIKTQEYNIPAILWSYNGKNSLSVYALKGNKKPKLDDAVCQAPFLNTSSNGKVCMGNVIYTNKTGKFDGYMDILQDLFYNSIFTHTNTNNLATVSIRDAYELAKDPKFNWDKYLYKTKLKISEVI